MFTLHIRPGQPPRLIKGGESVERALGVPLLMFQAIEGEEVISVRSRRTAHKILKTRGIGQYEMVTAKTMAVL